ncbi:hypothetical protein [Millisia brevis]|uniref:hypothetical protein n=1 Tax=Millisia brevis TaxID=264148 RepID=UPI0012EEB2E7|nr:hypothetical protein [Millisia brevis]
MVTAPPPPALRVAGALLALQGVGLLISATVLAFRGLQAGGVDGGLVIGSWFAIAGVALTTAGVCLVRGRRWARSFGLVIQLLLVPVVWSLTTTGQGTIGALLGVVVVAVLLLLFTPASVRWWRGLDDETPAEPPADRKRAR